MQENEMKRTHAVVPPPGKRDKKRFGAAKMGPGGRGPGGGPRHGRPMEKVKLKNAKGTIVRLLGYLRHVWVELVIAALALIISTVATLVTPKISGDLIDVLSTYGGVNKAGFAMSVAAIYIGTALATQTGLKMSSRAKEKGAKFTTLGGEGLFLGITLTVAGGASTAVQVASSAAPMDQLIRLLWIMGGLYLASTLLSLIQQIVLVRVSQHTVRVLRKDLFDRIQTLPLRFFDSRPHGELMSRLTNDVDNVSNMLSNTITQVMSSAITLVVSLAMMLYLSWVLTLVSFITIPLSMIVIRKITKYTGKLFKQQQASLGELNGIVEETVTGSRVVKVFTREPQVIEDFDRANEELTEAGVKATIFSSVIGPMMNAINNLGFALMASIGGFLVVGGHVSVGMIQSFLQYQRQFSRPINDLANQVTMVQSALAGAERVFEIMDEASEPADAPNAVALKNPQGHVLFDDVTFGYTAERMILKNVSFEAKPGQTIALVGPTGAGTTTIVNLLMRFYDLNGGHVYIDGHDITDIRRQDLRDSLGMVLQDVYLFAGTVRENIAYGNLDATEEQIIEAAKMANCHNFITQLPQGYDTILSEDGGNISQGQRQLLSIARAILANPSVLILDEATSSVDTRTEMRIQSAMLNLMEGRTSFVIAHRLSTIRNADCIMVINGGEIIERGTHAELIEKDGFYANMLNSQFRATKKIAG
ncbi:MAG: ABC transporter ATP-binding protein [Clostridia bacterium]|nr:ABC transporter ATP-binding protein [Clostridia bacterium]